MLLETRIDDAVIYIDSEASGGIDKSVFNGDFDPDRIVDNVVGVVGLMARKLSEAAGQASVSVMAPSRIEIRFGVKVDGNSVVAVARDAAEAQFQVMVEWSPGR